MEPMNLVGWLWGKGENLAQLMRLKLQDDATSLKAVSLLLRIVRLLAVMRRQLVPG